MKRKQIFIGGIILVFVFASLATPGICGDKPITLSAVSAFPKFSGSTKSFLNVIKVINERAKGRLTVKYRGSMEVIKSTDQVPAVRDGAIDMAHIVFSEWGNWSPEFTLAMLTQCSVTDERTNGLYDFWTKAFAKLNVRYLGQPHLPGQFYAFLTKKVATRDDFKGVVLSGRSWAPFIAALGATPATIDISEYYSAMDRGLTNGTLWAVDQFRGRKGYEVCKYWVDVPFYRTAFSAVINMDSWKKIPKDLQDLILQVVKEQEEIDAVTSVERLKAMWKELKDHGMQPITLSAEDTQWYLDAAYNSVWEEQKSKVDPADYAILRKLLTLK